MKFQISTLVLCIAIVVLGVGWLTERAYKDAAHASEIKRLLNGTMHTIHADRTIRLADYYFEAPEKYPEILNEKLAWGICWLWTHQAHIDEVLTRENSGYCAQMQADDALKLLKCDTEQEFFEIARKMDAFEGNEEIFPEFFDTNSDEFKSLQAFITDSIKNMRTRER